MPMLLNIILKILTLATIITASTVVELNSDNWDKVTKGKTIWVKFCTKTCAHCQQMHIAWERLGDAWVDDEVSVLGLIELISFIFICLIVCLV